MDGTHEEEGPGRDDGCDAVVKIDKEKKTIDGGRRIKMASVLAGLGDSCDGEEEALGG